MENDNEYDKICRLIARLAIIITTLFDLSPLIDFLN
jgi:hypothetical protein